MTIQGGGPRPSGRLGLKRAGAAGAAVGVGRSQGARSRGRGWSYTADVLTVLYGRFVVASGCPVS